jgi:hypothetical protein
VSPFAGDDGSPDPALLAVLYAFRDGTADLHAVQRALVGARVLVPVLAVLDELGESAGGAAVESRAHMSGVTVAGRDGRRAQPMFTSMQALRAWNDQARPVPASAVDVARGAYAEGAHALLVDPAGPVHLVLEGPAMLALAECRLWLPPAEDPEVLAAVGDALAGLPGLAGVDVTGSADADLTLTLHVPQCAPDAFAREPAAADAQAFAHAFAQRVAQDAANRLASVDLLRYRLERGLDLAVTPT